MGANRKPLDARKIDFFKGLNQKSSDGLTLSLEIPAGTLSNGKYRICSITGSNSHQPVIMPVARRGSQDDCIRVNVKNNKQGDKKKKKNA